MAVTPTEPDLQGQQVMTAQVTEATLQSRGVGHSTLEGESQGPDYGRQQSQPPQLPNGVARASPTSSVRTVDGIESLPYSPQVDPATRPAQAFFQEAWPAQPQNADVGSSDSRSAEGVPAAFPLDAQTRRFSAVSVCDGNLYDDDEAAVGYSGGRWRQFCASAAEGAEDYLAFGISFWWARGRSYW